MPISWNEIKNRAPAFSREWQNASSEGAEAKSFWGGFFNIFGISRKRIASFEELVNKLGDKQRPGGVKIAAIEAERVAFLFERYWQLTSLFPAASGGKGSSKTPHQGERK